jgi:hypothetical protein
MSDPNSTSPDILLDGPAKDISRPVYSVVVVICNSESYGNLFGWDRV